MPTDMRQLAFDYAPKRFGNSWLIRADCPEWFGRVPNDSTRTIVADPPYGVKKCRRPSFCLGHGLRVPLALCVLAPRYWLHVCRGRWRGRTTPRASCIVCTQKGKGGISWILGRSQVSSCGVQS
jgi:hypothetical protein